MKKILLGCLILANTLVTHGQETPVGQEDVSAKLTDTRGAFAKRLTYISESDDNLDHLYKLMNSKLIQEKQRIANERKAFEAEKKRQAEVAKQKTKTTAKQQAIYHRQMAIKNKVMKQWISPANVPNGLSVKLAIKLSSSGKIIASPRVLQSSGYQAFDNSAIEAVKRASPLPLPNEKVWVNEFTKEDLILNFP